MGSAHLEIIRVVIHQAAGPSHEFIHFTDIAWCLSWFFEFCNHIKIGQPNDNLIWSFDCDHICNFLILIGQRNFQNFTLKWNQIFVLRPVRRHLDSLHSLLLTFHFQTPLVVSTPLLVQNNSSFCKKIGIYLQANTQSSNQRPRRFQMRCLGTQHTFYCLRDKKNYALNWSWLSHCLLEVAIPHLRHLVPGKTCSDRILTHFCTIVSIR